jgi:hypothetical protein
VHGSSNLANRALMLFGERQILMDQKQVDRRMIHGKLIPYELRTGVGIPKKNLPPVFDLVRRYVADEKFIAVSEGPEDLDVLNAAIVLEPGEFIELRMLTDDLTTFLDGNEEDGVTRAGFNTADKDYFRKFIREVGPEVAIVLLKAGYRPFLLVCHRDRVEEAASLFLADALWTRGLPDDGAAMTAREFPFHIDLADSVARTLFKGAELGPLRRGAGPSRCRRRIRRTDVADTARRACSTPPRSSRSPPRILPRRPHHQVDDLAVQPLPTTPRGRIGPAVSGVFGELAGEGGGLVGGCDDADLAQGCRSDRRGCGGHGWSSLMLSGPATLPAMGAFRPWHLITLGCVGLICVGMVTLAVFLAVRASKRP